MTTVAPRKLLTPSSNKRKGKPRIRIPRQVHPSDMPQKPIKESVPSIVEEFRRDPLLTPREVASIFRVDEKTINRWAKAGKLGKEGKDIFYTPGRHRRYRRSSILKLMGEPLQKDFFEGKFPIPPHIVNPG